MLNDDSCGTIVASEASHIDLYIALVLAINNNDWKVLVLSSFWVYHIDLYESSSTNGEESGRFAASAAASRRHTRGLLHGWLYIKHFISTSKVFYFAHK